MRYVLALALMLALASPLRAEQPVQYAYVGVAWED